MSSDDIAVTSPSFESGRRSLPSAWPDAARRAAGAQQAPDRSKPPAPGPAPALKLPPIQKRALSNGLPVWIVEMHEVPGRRRHARSSSPAPRPIRPASTASPASRPRCSTRARARETRSSSPTRSISSARRSARAARSTRRRVRLHTPVSKLDEALPLMADVAAAADVSDSRARAPAQGAADDVCCRRATTPAALASAGVRAAGLRPAPSLRHAGDGQRGVEQGDAVADLRRLLHGELPAAERAPARRRRRHAGQRRCRSSSRRSARWKNAGAGHEAGAADGAAARRRARSISSTSRARRSRRSASAGSASRAARRTTSCSTC